MATDEDLVTVIKVVGVGGAGGNAVNRMIVDGLKGVEFIVINTDSKSQNSTLADVKLELFTEGKKGQGAGGDPTVAEAAFEAYRDDIKAALEGADLIFIAAGEGGGTGTGGAPIVASIAKELGALTLAVVTRPFTHEGKKKHQIADEGIEKLRNEVDALIVIPNQKILDSADEKTTLLNALYEADRALRQGVEGITDIILSTGVFTTDFADVKTILKNSGTALMGIGRASGTDRAQKATEEAINSPLNEVSIDNSTGALVKISASDQISAKEMDAIFSAISDKLDPNALFITGVTTNNDLDEDIVVTVIASGVGTSDAAKGTELNFSEQGFNQNNSSNGFSGKISSPSSPVLNINSQSNNSTGANSEPQSNSPGSPVEAVVVTEVDEHTEIISPVDQDDGLPELPEWAFPQE
jgi:cell division protein FtsZ